MTAIRVVIAWIYTNTKSVLVCQVLHISSTGSLVIFTPTGATAAQEVLWYFVYAFALWAVVAVIGVKYGKHLSRQSSS
jgi:hypothetical protein